MTSVTEHLFDTGEEMVETLSAEIAQWLAAAVADRGLASFVVTGGSTPRPLYERLSQVSLPWDLVRITLSDERWVPTTDPASNERLVRDTLLKGPAAAAHLVGLKTVDATPQAGGVEADGAIEAMARPFDLVLLGMGGDGHIASLFPHNPALTAALDPYSEALVCAVEAEQGAGASARLSLTLRTLLDARLIIVMVKGQDKLDIWREALAGDDVHAIPARALIQQDRVPVRFFWAP